MKKAILKAGLASLALLPCLAMAADPVVVDKADNAFMMICTALVLFMSIPGIALFYGGLIRGKNVLSMLTQVAVTFALVCVLWVVYGYSLAFGTGGSFFGSFDWVMLKNIELKALMGTIYQYIHVAFQGSFACITVGLIVGALAERIRFSAVLIFVVVWLTLSYVPIAHMVWGGGLLATHGAMDFAGGTVVHINAAVAGLVGAYLIGKRVGFGKEAFKPHNLPMVFTGTAILYFGWFGFNAGSASAANEIAGLAFVNTVVATAGAILSWVFGEWALRGKPSLLGACSGAIAGLVGITPACGYVGVGGALIVGIVAGLAGLWGVTALKRWLRVDDPCDVFGVHGVCGIVGCIMTGIFAATSLGGVGYAEGVTMGHQVLVQLESIAITIVWSGIVAFIGYKLADMTVGCVFRKIRNAKGWTSTATARTPTTPDRTELSPEQHKPPIGRLLLLYGRSDRRTAVTHHPFLYRGGDQYAIPVIKLPANKTACAGCRGAFHTVKQPVVQIERAMEPHGVVDGGDLHAFFEETNAVWLERNQQEVKVRRVAEQILLDA
jgi:Amt family ammonium transporter